MVTTVVGVVAVVKTGFTALREVVATVDETLFTELRGESTSDDTVGARSGFATCREVVLVVTMAAEEVRCTGLPVLTPVVVSRDERTGFAL